MTPTVHNNSLQLYICCSLSFHCSWEEQTYDLLVSPCILQPKLSEKALPAKVLSRPFFAQIFTLVRFKLANTLSGPRPFFAVFDVIV